MRTREQLLSELASLRQQMAELEEKERALRASESMHAAMMDAIDDAIHVNDAEGRYVALNAETARREAMTKEAMLGKTPFDFFEPDTATIAIEQYQHVFRTGQPLDVERDFEDRRPHHRHLHRAPLRSETGEVVGVVTVSRDITARWIAEDALRQERDFSAAVLDTIGSLLVVLDRDRRIVRMNRACEIFLGSRASEVVGLPASAVFRGATGSDKGGPAVRAALTGQYPDTRESTLIAADNQPRNIRWTNTALLDGSGEVEYVISVGTDITEYRASRVALEQGHERLTALVAEMERRNREDTLLSKMADLLQTCLTLDEAYSVFAHGAAQLFPGTSGGLFVISASRNLVDAAATWGNFPETERVFGPDQCWALRRGRTHVVDNPDGSMICRHVDAVHPPAYVCVPMMAQGETLGSLHLRLDDPASGAVSEREQLAVSAAEQIALALANLKLQQKLRDQAIHDLLTGLFNRRYMEEMLDRELMRASRRGSPIGVIMMDIDHFKKFNDLFGHDAGDAILSALGGYLRGHTRGEDIVCRYGGEEIAIVMPETSVEETAERAQELRAGIATITVEHRRQPLGTITVSMGISCYPAHGSNRETLFRAADRALYLAKSQGRDRVCVVGASPGSGPIQEASGGN
ncbi:MAG TPA: diguanylate cyclase [Chloroflexota bacterium]